MLLQEIILPVVKFENGCVTGVLGTAFIMQVGEMRFVVTAAHVLDAARDNDWHWGVLYKLDSGEIHAAGCVDYLKSEKFDLAAVPLLDFIEGIPEDALFQGDHVFPLSDDLATFEYSQCSIKALPDGDWPAFVIDPYFHKGHAMKRFFDEAGTPFMELSFPALQGASGAPVIRLEDNSVVGVLLGNRERHLMPAQVATVQIDEDSQESIAYFLPMGTALDVRAIAEFFGEEVPKLLSALEPREGSRDT